MGDWNRENHHDEHHATIQSLTEELDAANEWNRDLVASVTRLRAERGSLQSTVGTLRAALEGLLNAVAWKASDDRYYIRGESGIRSRDSLDRAVAALDTLTTEDRP